MAFESKIHKEAHKEYIDAYEWYELEKDGLGTRFMNEVEKCILEIRDNPEYHGFVQGKYRQARIPGFPYSIVYKFFPRRKLVHISSIFHTSRNPKEKFRK